MEIQKLVNEHFYFSCEMKEFFTALQIMNYYIYIKNYYVSLRLSKISANALVYNIYVIILSVYPQMVGIFRCFYLNKLAMVHAEL